jgi:hypothetical protein
MTPPDSLTNRREGTSPQPASEAKLRRERKGAKWEQMLRNISEDDRVLIDGPPYANIATTEAVVPDKHNHSTHFFGPHHYPPHRWIYDIKNPSLDHERWMKATEALKPSMAPGSAKSEQPISDELLIIPSVVTFSSAGTARPEQDLHITKSTPPRDKAFESDQRTPSHDQPTTINW